MIDGVVYRLEIIGGPYDGVSGFDWFDDGEHPPPDEIFVGVCPGAAECGSPRCVRSRRYPAYWTDVEDVPVATIKYEKQDEYVRRIGRGEREEFEGVAMYVMGGLDVLAVRTGRVELPVAA